MNVDPVSYFSHAVRIEVLLYCAMQAERAVKSNRVRIVAVLIIIFFMIPVNYAKQGMCLRSIKSIPSQLNESARVAGLEWIADESALPTFLANFVIALALIIMLVIGHIVSKVLSRQLGHVSISKMDVEGG